jgi:putative DNA primase/helicase
MRIDADRLLSEADIVTTVSRYLHLEKRGADHIGICPFHDDHKSSLQVNQTKQIYKCFACGAGGDAIDFLTRMGRTFQEACLELGGGDISGAVEPQKREPIPARPNSWKQIKPTGPVQHAIQHYRHGIAQNFWTYRDALGDVIGYVCRFDVPGGKEVIPYVYATDGSRSEWRWMGFENPRPLYNLDLIHKNQSATVILVEGEKTADAISRINDSSLFIVTTWIGGANGIDKADFSPIADRRVILWPDNDEPGRKAMFEISKKLNGEKSWVHVPKSFPEKWDAADKQWKEGEIWEFFEQKLGEIPTPASQKLQPIKNPPLPPIDPKETKSLNDNPHYRFLGYDKDENSRLVYYFFSFDAKAVIKLSPSSMTKANLMMLAPLNYWERQFPGNGKTKLDVDAATQFLMLNSHKVGTFKDKFIRGRGAWVDDGKILIHAGDTLIVNRELMPLSSIKSRYVYEIGERLGYGTSQPATTIEASKIIERAKWLLWEREINAYLLTGWCVIAPFCGVLQWRPHIWVTGPAGSGKSWVMDNFVKRLIGDTGIVVQGKTTEAGVRGLLQNDARAVLFDESDVDNNNDKERIQNILSLARSASYHDGGLIGKGTQTGASRTYIMRSCFAFSSIGVHVNQQSDRSRFTTLSLLSFEGQRRKEDFVAFEHTWNKLVTDEFVKSIQSRTIELLPVILKNARTFADAVAAVIGQRRIGDQVGAMLAGAYSLTSSKEISYEDAVKWVEARDWTEERGLELTKDEYQLFGRIMGHITSLETETGRIDRSIGEIIMVAIGLRSEYGSSQYAAQSRLRRLGIMVKDDRILIANQSEGITSIIRDTAWSKNYSRILERLPNAERVEPRTYTPGIKSRGVSVPLSIVTEAMNDFRDDPLVSRNSNQFESGSNEVPF